MEFAEVVRRRRMVRDFEERDLAPGVAERVVAAGLRAPSAGYTQGTELLVLEAAADRARFWDAVIDPAYRPRMPWPGLVRAPLVVVVFAHEEAYRRRYGEADKRGQGDGRAVSPWWTVDAAFAAMLVLLAATDEGLGALFFAVRHPAALRSTFAVPEAFDPIGAVAVGHPGDDRPSPSLARIRRPPADVLHRGRW